MSAWGELAEKNLTKGHGTGNDFVFLTDPEAAILLDAELVARVCDRHFGIGADGFIGKDLFLPWFPFEVGFVLDQLDE